MSNPREPGGDEPRDLVNVPPVGHFEQFTVLNGSGHTITNGVVEVRNGILVTEPLSGVISGPADVRRRPRSGADITQASYDIQVDGQQLKGCFDVAPAGPYFVLSVQIFLHPGGGHEGFVWLRSRDPLDMTLVRMPMLRDGDCP
jgi:hypothetical protein